MSPFRRYVNLWVDSNRRRTMPLITRLHGSLCECTVIWRKVESRSHRFDIAQRPSQEDVQASVNVLVSIHLSGHFTVELLEHRASDPGCRLRSSIDGVDCRSSRRSASGRNGEPSGLPVSHVRRHRGIGEWLSEIEVQPDRQIRFARELRGAAESLIQTKALALLTRPARKQRRIESVVATSSPRSSALTINRPIGAESDRVYAMVSADADRTDPAARGPKRRRVLVGFADALAAIESVWSLVDAGFSVSAFTRAGSCPGPAQVGLGRTASDCRAGARRRGVSA